MTSVRDKSLDEKKKKEKKKKKKQKHKLNFYGIYLCKVALFTFFGFFWRGEGSGGGGCLFEHNHIVLIEC